MSAAKVIVIAPNPIRENAAVRRYRRLYDVAEKTIRLGETIRLGSVVVGGLLIVAASLAYQMSRAAHSAYPTAAVWLVACAILVVLAAHIWGTVFRIQGHVLEATIDSAANTSPFLSQAERTEVMGLGTQEGWQEGIRAAS